MMPDSWLISWMKFRGFRMIAITILLGTAQGSSISNIASDTSTSTLTSPLVSTGLKNLGNTCYMNAQLQCAFHIPAVRRITLAEDEKTDQPIEDDEAEEASESSNTPETVTSDALRAMQGIITEMTQAADQRLPAVAPRSFCFRLGIPVMVQQDSQEFWKLLLPAMNKESLSNLYKGSFEDYIVALDGSGREKRREELFLDLSLDISPCTLPESFRQSFAEPELLSVVEGNGWRPEKGAEKVDANKGSSLIAKGLPSILQCHLKRFNYDWQTDTMTKLNNRFEFPEVLDLSGLCQGAEECDQDLTTYDLQSVVIHMGEYGVGHYYAYVRPDIESNKWYRFNDDAVEEVSIDDVIEDAFGGKSNKQKPKKVQGPFAFVRRLFSRGGNGNDPCGWGGKTSNAYILQYVRRCDIPMLYGEQ